MKSLVVHSTQSNHRNFDLRNKFLRQTASLNQRPRLQWVATDGFVVDTALGQFTAPVLTLDTASKRALHIPVDTVVMLPGEDIRVRLDQVQDYCNRVLKGCDFVNGFEVAYMMELLDAESDVVAGSLGVDAVWFDSIVMEDDAFPLGLSQQLAMFFSHACASRTGRIHYCS